MTADERMFILWSGSDFGGLERRYLRLAGHLANEGAAKVTLLCQERALGSVQSVLGDSQLKVTPVTLGPWTSMLPTPLVRIIELVRMSLMMRSASANEVVFCGNPGFIAGVLSIFKRRSQSLAIPNALLFVDLPLGFMDRLGIKVTARFGATIDHLSDEPRQVLEKVAGDSFQRFSHFTAPGSFTDYSLVGQSAQRDIDVIMLARFVEGKGYDLLERIDEHVRDCNAHYCGFGPRKIDVHHAKVYQATEPFRLLARSKIFLSIQQGNNYPSQSLLEAMASGCAIIATDVGETRKLLDETRAVLISYDAQELLNAIQSLMRNETLRERLGNAARDYVLSHHTVEQYAYYFTNRVLTS